MKKFKRNIRLYYVFLFLLSLLVGLYFRMNVPAMLVQEDKADDYSILATNMVSILSSLMDDSTPRNPDLAIEKVVLKKIEDPSDDFNFYKYSAVVFVHNYGDSLRNAKVILHSDSDRSHLFLENTRSGFTLKSGEDYLVRGYEVLFDGRYNGGKIKFTIGIEDDEIFDTDENNDEFSVEVFELPSKIKSLSVDKFLEDGGFYINFQDDKLLFSDTELITYFSNELEYRENSLRYRELYTLNDLYPYFWINNSKKLLESGDWEAVRNSALDPKYIEPKDPILASEEETYFYLKSIDKDSGYYKISDVLAFVPVEEINRAQFARIFVDELGLETEESSVNLYSDINAEDWYGPAVSTIYNMGLTDINKFQYLPEEKMSRAEVLRVVLDYFDVDLVFDDFDQRFADVNEEDFVFPYAQALSAGNKGLELANYFEPESAATKSFLKYLINEYSESN